MRFLFFLILSFCFGDEIDILINNKIIDQNSSKNLLQIDKVLSINNNLKIENNESKIANLKLEKIKIIEQIPQNIMEQKIAKTQFQNYLKDKKKYENLAKQGNLQAKSKLKIINLQESFYLGIFELENQFIKGATSKKIEEILEKNIENIEKIEPFKNMSNLKDFENSKETFIEILTFLKNSSENLGDKSVFMWLNLSSWIKKINQILPFDFAFFNFGKLVIIVFITIFFYIFRRFFAFIIYKILHYFSGNRQNENKNIAINMLIFPIGILLLTYSFDICVDIAFYPTPTPKIFINLFKIIYILIYAWLIIRILDCYSIILIDRVNIKKRHKDILNLTTKFLYVVVVIVAILMILSKLGFNTSAIVASFGIGGLAIAFASKDIIANFFASVMMIFDDSFYQGDNVNFNGIEGIVVETGLRKTSIRTSDNSLIFIPNSKLIDGVIKNISRKKVGNLITLFLRLDYSTKKSKIEIVIKKIEKFLLSCDDLVAVKKSQERQKFYVSVDDLVGYKSGINVFLNDFSEKGIVIKISCYTKSVISKEFDAIKQEVMFKILEILEEENIKFAPSII